MVTIYGCLRSRALRPLWLLREMGAPHDWVPVVQAYRLPDPADPDAPFHTARPEFLAINPMAQVPAMTDGGLMLAESVAITHHLARKFGGPLSFADLAEEALALQWALLGVSAVETPALQLLMVHANGQAATPEGEAQRRVARAALARPFKRIEAHLGAHDWLVGDRFTAADILLAECVRFAMDEPGVFDAYPALHRWLTAARARPVFQTLWAEREAEPMTFD